MTFPLAQFVDGPSATAALRYDFTMQTASLRTLVVGGDGLDLGAPPFDGEPGGVGGRYGYRAMRFTQRVIGSKTDALARMNTLARELLRSDNWLRVQLDPTRTPVYFKTYRTEPGALSLEHIETAGAWDITVPLVADPFAYGPRVTLANVTIFQNPSGTNPMRYVLPAIKGDAPTGLRFNLAPANNAGFGSQWLVGCIAGAASMEDTVVTIGTGDIFSINVDAAPITTGDAAFFNSDYRTLTLPGTDPFKLVASTFPVTARGRYKLMLRCELTGNATYKIWAVQRLGATSTQFATPVVASGETFRGWLDLGEFSFPLGSNVSDDQGATFSGPNFLYFYATTIAGTGTAKVDAFKLVPVDGPTVSSATLLKFRTLFTGVFNTARNLTLDGDDETYWAKVNATGDAYPLLLEQAGAYPVADPASAQNLLVIMVLDRGTTPGASPHVSDTGAQTTLGVSYYPRYLHVGDGT